MSNETTSGNADCPSPLAPSVIRRTAPQRSGVVPEAERERLAAGFGARLRELRTARSWTQADAAARVGITERAYQHLERGRRRPSAEVLGSIALHLAPGDTAEAVLDELLELGGASVTTGRRRRFRKDARAVLMLSRAVDRLPADSPLLAVLRPAPLADRVSAHPPLTSANTRGEHHVSTQQPSDADQPRRQERRRTSAAQPTPTHSR